MTCPHRRARISLTLSHETEKHCADCGAELPVTEADRDVAEYVGDIIVEQWTLKDEYEQDDAAVAAISGRGQPPAFRQEHA